MPVRVVGYHLGHIRWNQFILGHHVRLHPDTHTIVTPHNHHITHTLDTKNNVHRLLDAASQKVHLQIERPAVHIFIEVADIIYCAIWLCSCNQ